MSPEDDRRKVLISGGGIAGLTAAVLLEQGGWEPLVVERQPAPSAEGYMMDFAGTGWDVAERMGLTDALRAVRYPIDSMRYADRDGRTYFELPIDRVRRALDGRYVYIRRPDLERILFDRACEVGAAVRFGTSVRSLDDAGDGVRATFEDGDAATFALVIGADGVHSRVRELAFGPESEFGRYLGYYAAAFSLPRAPEVGRSFVIYEEADRVASFYPTSDERMDALYVFRTADLGHVSQAERLPTLRERFAGAGWITERMLDEVPGGRIPLFDSLTQIIMPRWSSGRVALIGDACGCLTLAAGQGSHMAMGGGFVLATELARHPGDHVAAFDAYERFFKPHVARRQQAAARLASSFVPSRDTRIWLRRLAIRAMFSPPLLRLTVLSFGARSVLRGYP